MLYLIVSIPDLWTLSYFAYLILGEAGIYISIYDATAIDKRSFGLEHFFFMKSMDLLYQECCNTDLVKIRAALVQRGVLKDCYVERFEPGNTFNP